MAQQLLRPIFSGAVSRHFSELNHPDTTILVTTNTENLLAFLVSLRFSSCVLSLVPRLSARHSRSGVSTNSSHQDRVSAAVGLPLLGFFCLHITLFTSASGISLFGFTFLLFSIWLFSFFTCHFARWERRFPRFLKTDHQFILSREYILSRDLPSDILFLAMVAPLLGNMCQHLSLHSNFNIITCLSVAFVQITVDKI